MRLDRPIIIKCNRCGEIVEIDMDFDCVSVEERSMGDESEYEGMLEDVCPCCANEIEIRCSVWEYPLGVVNYHDEKIEGADILDGPEYNPFDGEEW